MSDLRETNSSPSETPTDQTPLLEPVVEYAEPIEPALLAGEQQQPLESELLEQGGQAPLLQPPLHDDSEQSALQQLGAAQRRVAAKTEHLRQLKLVRTYRHREETRDLDQVTARWLTACQDGLRDYYQKVKETATEDTNNMEDMTFANFIEKLGIDKKLVSYDETGDDFLN